MNATASHNNMSEHSHFKTFEGTGGAQARTSTTSTTKNEVTAHNSNGIKKNINVKKSSVLDPNIAPYMTLDHYLEIEPYLKEEPAWNLSEAGKWRLGKHPRQHYQQEQQQQQRLQQQQQQQQQQQHHLQQQQLFQTDKDTFHSVPPFTNSTHNQVQHQEEIHLPFGKTEHKSEIAQVHSSNDINPNTQQSKIIEPISFPDPQFAFGYKIWFVDTKKHAKNKHAVIVERDRTNRFRCPFDTKHRIKKAKRYVKHVRKCFWGSRKGHNGEKAKLEASRWNKCKYDPTHLVHTDYALYHYFYNCPNSIINKT